MRTRKYRMFGTMCYTRIKNDTLGCSGQSCFMLKDNLCKESATSLTVCRHLNDLELPKPVWYQPCRTNQRILIKQTSFQFYS